jgi:proteic killer suppression protein
VTDKVTLPLVIKSFAHKGLEKYFLAGNAAGIQAIHTKRLRLILAQLDKAKTIDDMDIPTLHLHELKGSRKGVWSVTVQANWRVTFRLVDGDAEVVNYEDYH